MSARRIQIPPGEAARLDVALAGALEVSRSHAAGLIACGQVRREDGAPVKKAGQRAEPGEWYVVEIPQTPAQTELAPQNLPLCIVYEDEDLAVIDKARGMAVHPSPGIADGTLVNACLYHLGSLSGIHGELRPGIVHRLDKDTTGLLVVAKNDAAHEALCRALAAREIHRKYLALVHGAPREGRGMVDAPIGRHPTDRKRMAVVANGRPAQTEYAVIARYPGLSLVGCKLRTGRTHQIRVHMASIGCPVCQDPVYGIRRERERATGQLLHAFCLEFAHPRTGETVRCFAAPPADFTAAVRRAGGVVQGEGTQWQADGLSLLRIAQMLEET